MRHHKLILSLPMNVQRGFTLIEVLIALFIMGVTTAAILVLISQNTRFQVQGEERLMAAIVADNVMVETLANPAPLDRGLIEGEIIIDARLWRYELIISETTIPSLVTVKVKVRGATSPQVITQISSLKSELP